MFITRIIFEFGTSSFIRFDPTEPNSIIPIPIPIPRGEVMPTFETSEKLALSPNHALTTQLCAAGVGYVTRIFI
jgi:hypothetical protein